MECFGIEKIYDGETNSYADDEKIQIVDEINPYSVQYEEGMLGFKYCIVNDDPITGQHTILKECKTLYLFGYYVPLEILKEKNRDGIWNIAIKNIEKMQKKGLFIRPDGFHQAMDCDNDKIVVLNPENINIQTKIL